MTSSCIPSTSSISSSELFSKILSVTLPLPLFGFLVTPLTLPDVSTSISSSLLLCSASAFIISCTAASLRAFLVLDGSLGPPFFSSSSLEDLSSSSSSSSSKSSPANNLRRYVSSSSESSDSSSSSDPAGSYTIFNVARAGVSPLTVPVCSGVALGSIAAIVIRN